MAERAELTPVGRGGLTDRVIHELRRRIVDGSWPLHHRLPVEATLARDLGVGRSTVREAVRVLVHAGMLEVRQGDGTFVRSSRETDAALGRRVREAGPIEAFEARRGLEIEIARLAALRATDADVAALRELADRRAAAYAGSAARYARADVELREHLLAMTGNALLADLHRGVVGPLRASPPAGVDDAELTRDDPGRPGTPALVEAIARRDPAAAAAAAGEHMDGVLRLLHLVLQVVPPPVP